MSVSNKPGPSGKILLALLLMGAFQAVNFYLVLQAVKSQWYGFPVALAFVGINLIGAVVVKFPKWGRYLWATLFLVNFGLVSQGLALTAQMLAADSFVLWLVGLPLWVFLSVQINRYFVAAMQSG